ncbi:OpgC domain-containing protein [Breoghania sp.]|uniref:OpgC domain-containing protein n=1 Tax=Breoghania sp. TaxID=2065378 RepID=UPI002635D5D0|nr:OpgC domain-containing protein [Breoghania sp.]MDJ0930046.1 OpgC domain-containing protein [Breoghania sp.]
MATGEAGSRLRGSGAWGAFVRIVQKVGQQPLAVFLMSLVTAQAIAILRDQFLAEGYVAQILSNLAGFAVLIATAYVIGWFK